jgi:hypothetical protein
MLKEIMHLDDEAEARRILMRLGNGLSQVDTFILDWKAAKEEAKPKITITQKVVTAISVVKETEVPTQAKVVDSE